MYRGLSHGLARAVARQLAYSDGITGTAYGTLSAATSTASGTVHPAGTSAASLDALTSTGWATHTDAALEFDFQHGVADPRLTVSRTGSAWTFDSTGTLVSVAANTLRIWHDPITLQRLGFLQEETRTQSIKNSSATGGVAGTPGTPPTGYAAFSGGGLSRDLAFGTENGMPYTQIRVYGTASGAVASVLLGFVGSGDIASANGQTWTGSVYVKQTAGTGKQLNLTTSERDAGGALLGSSGPNFTATSSYARQTATRINTNASTALETLEVRLNCTDGEVIDATWRFAIPQCELGAWATSPMLTTTAAITRNIDLVSVTSLGAWFNPAEGTMYVDFTPQAIASTLQTYLYFDDGGANERMGIRSSSTSNSMLAVDGGAALVNATIGTIAAGGNYKCAFGYKLNDFAGAQNGGSVATDTGGTVPTVTAMKIGYRLTNGEPANAIFRKVKIYTTRKTNAEIQAMTV
jgi:hypothetical protein